MADDPLPHAEGADTPGRVPPAVRHPPWLFGALAAIAGAALIVVLLGWTIDRGHVFAFDRAILLAMRDGADPVGPPLLERAMIGITALGSGTVLMIVVLATAALLAFRRLWLTAWLVLAATFSGRIVVVLAKDIVGRPRPEVIDPLVHVSSASFPSGHSANGAIVNLTLATLLAQVVKGRARRNFILAAAVLLVIAIGCSRVYLGVHWPSDVLAGWGFGALWALGWWALAVWIRLRRAGAAPP
jgi:undecaprenyl-diphosphatase